MTSPVDLTLAAMMYASLFVQFKVALTVDTADNTAKLTTFWWDDFATFLTFVAWGCIEFLGVGKATLDSLLGDVIGLVDDVGHGGFLLSMVESEVGYALLTHPIGYKFWLVRDG